MSARGASASLHGPHVWVRSSQLPRKGSFRGASARAFVRDDRGLGSMSRKGRARAYTGTAVSEQSFRKSFRKQHASTKPSVSTARSMFPELFPHLNLLGTST